MHYKTLTAILASLLLFGTSCKRSYESFREPPRIPGTNRRYLNKNDQVTYGLISQPTQKEEYSASFPKNKSEEVQVFGEILRSYKDAEGSERIIDVKPITDTRSQSDLEKKIRKEGYKGKITFQQLDN